MKYIYKHHHNYILQNHEKKKEKKQFKPPEYLPGLFISADEMLAFALIK